jgi:hypothetical protein
MTAPGEEGRFLAGDPPSGAYGARLGGALPSVGSCLEVMRRRRSCRNPASHLECDLPHIDSGMRGGDDALDPRPGCAGRPGLLLEFVYLRAERRRANATTPNSAGVARRQAPGVPAGPP